MHRAGGVDGYVVEMDSSQTTMCRKINASAAAVAVTWCVALYDNQSWLTLYVEIKSAHDYFTSEKL